ncbi:MAG: hypothetical protein FD147_705 [Chloroflexi bacterium]|nr:MAG: hypothetical protein FD147_705 [Chloroflexota bacterium]MBA4376239.1 hypothetical protein [Anaerolinea sp.]
MKIRSITSFFDPAKAPVKQTLEPLARFSRDLQKRCEEKGFIVQSTRAATPPFTTYLSPQQENWIKEIRHLESLTQELGWAYLSAGPATPESPNSYVLIPSLLAATQNVFFGGVIADKKQVYPAALRASANIIVESAKISPDGFANLRFAALANVPPFAPFFPAAYHESGHNPAFSLAIECADEAVKAFSGLISLEEARNRFLIALEQNAERLTDICNEMSAQYKVVFKGLDFSPAPFPEDWCSLGKAFETLGLDHIGGAGSLAAAAFIADALDRGKWQRAGFNGLMLAVLEDSILAARAEAGLLSIKDLLLYSAVCGTGLDTIPLPGNTTVGSLSAVLLDLGALAVRLGKPLTGRLMPIPGKQAGDKTEFDFGFFANSRVMALDSQEIRAPLLTSEPIQLNPRKTSAP